MIEKLKLFDPNKEVRMAYFSNSEDDEFDTTYVIPSLNVVPLVEEDGEWFLDETAEGSKNAVMTVVIE